MRRRPAWRLAALAAVAVPVALLTRAAVTHVRLALNAPGPPTVGAVATTAARARPPRAVSEETIKRACARPRCPVHLDRADDEARRAIAANLAALDAFFAAARSRAPRFAERVLGWEGHWHRAAGLLGVAGGDRHGVFLATAFGDLVFTPGQVEGQARRVVEDCLGAERDVEGRMMVAIRLDMADLPVSLPIVTPDKDRLRSLIGSATDDAAVLAGVALRDDLARELVALAVGEALAQAAVRLGASAGLRGAGAASSVGTLGVGLAAGLVVDRVVAWAWDFYSDPRGALARETAARVDEIRRLVVEGTAAAPGLRPRLEGWARARAASRRAAVLGLIGREEGEP